MQLREDLSRWPRQLVLWPRLFHLPEFYLFIVLNFTERATSPRSTWTTFMMTVIIVPTALFGKEFGDMWVECRLLLTSTAHWPARISYTRKQKINKANLWREILSNLIFPKFTHKEKRINHQQIPRDHLAQRSCNRLSTRNNITCIVYVVCVQCPATSSS